MSEKRFTEEAPTPGRRYFVVSEEIVAECRVWSEPVQFKFVGDDDRVEMVLRTVNPCT